VKNKNGKTKDVVFIAQFCKKLVNIKLLCVPRPFNKSLFFS